MKNALRRIEESLARLERDPDRREAAIREMRAAIDSLEQSPVQDEVHGILAEAPEAIDASLSSEGTERPSLRLSKLRERYDEKLEEHPNLVLEIGRISDAFASLGL
ncbi:MAG: hypothetical protein WD342_16500 [Verrucomicrobiales bacterium]